MKTRTVRSIVLCGVCGFVMTLTASQAQAQPMNDNCVDAIAIQDGATAFSTIGANTDGPAHGSGLRQPRVSEE